MSRQYNYTFAVSNRDRDAEFLVLAQAPSWLVARGEVRGNMLRRAEAWLVCSDDPRAKQMYYHPFNSVKARKK